MSLAASPASMAPADCAAARPLRVLCLSVYTGEGPSVRHRICGYRERWERAGVELTLKPFLTDTLFRRRRRFGLGATLYKAAALAFCTLRLLARLATVPRYDAVIMHREVFPVGGAWFETMVARLNPRTVFDLDDALWLPIPLVVDQRRFLWNPERVARTVGSSAAVVAGNDYLAAYARCGNDAVSVIPTPYLDLGGGARVDAPGSPPVIVWIGNVGNEEYLELVRAPLEALARKYDFVLRIIGSRDAAQVRMEGVKVEALEWREDKEREWLLECAIGIMPLYDREYERGKCAFKLVQYLSAGMPVVASPIGMNTEVVQDGVNGFLASGAGEWQRALDRLLGNAPLRREMGARGYATFRERFTRERNAGLWLEVFERLCPGRLPRATMAAGAPAPRTLPADYAPGRRIRAAFDVHVIGRRATGNETYAEGLLEAFEARPPLDVDLLYYHSMQGSGEGARKRFRRIRPDWPYVRIPITTPYYLKRDGVEVAHFQYIAPPVCPCPTVLTIHDLSYERHPEFFSSAMAARMKALMPWMARKATRLITVSEATRRDLVELYGLDPAKIDVIYNGAAAEFRVEANREALARTLARFNLARPFIICVGNLGRRKNQVRVVRAFGRLVRDRGLGHDLVLIGKEEFSADAVRSEIGRAGVEGRVHVTGFVSRAELIAFYNLAEFSVYPSLYEGFGLPIVESMACGTPVVTSTASCMPEIAGDAALLVDPEDDDALHGAMDRMLGDAALRERLRAAGLARSRAFTWREAARQTLDTYRRTTLTEGGG